MTDEPSYEGTFSDLASDPERWLSSGLNLLAAADLLWATVEEDFRNTPLAGAGRHADIADTPQPRALLYAAPYLMLAGFAVENALKGLRVAQGLRVTKEAGGKLSTEVLTHNLIRLAQDANVPLSPAEQALLERLGAYLRWAGRYPVATAAAGLAVVQNIYASDRAEVMSLFQSIRSRCLASGRPEGL